MHSYARSFETIQFFPRHSRGLAASNEIEFSRPAFRQPLCRAQAQTSERSRYQVSSTGFDLESSCLLPVIIHQPRNTNSPLAKRDRMFHCSLAQQIGEL